MSVQIREADEGDVPAIRAIFETIYGGDYPYQGFFDDRWLKRSIFGEDILMLVAEERQPPGATPRVIGAASVICDVGAHSDLIGEFGRLVVHPDARGRGVGTALMEHRVAFTSARLHVGIVENRTVHPYSQRSSETHGFRPVGFLPLKLLFDRRESVALYTRHFGVALSLRRNHPHIAPEVYPLAHLALPNVGLPCDAIVDEEAPAYPCADGWDEEELTAEGMPSLLRIERGRVRNREVFGPMRLHYGFFKLAARSATYLLAREPGRGPGQGAIAGAVGFLHDRIEHSVRIFELIAPGDQAIRFLLSRVVERCRDTLGVKYLEIDVRADAPRMQRTLIELGFVPAAYVPALVFHEVERLDVVKMVRLLTEPEVGALALTDRARELADQVLRAFSNRAVRPRIAAALGRLSLFAGLGPEQATRLAVTCGVAEFADGEALFAAGESGEQAHIVMAGEVEVRSEEAGAPARLGTVGAGEVVGELSLLSGEPHSLGAVARGPVVTATLGRTELAELSRSRPDIALVLYRNFAIALGDKLRRLDRTLLESLRPQGG